MTDHTSIIEKIFACPVCGRGMRISEDGKSAKCDGINPKNKQHSFDFSSEGYLSFGVTGGDSREAVAARRAFLRDTGLYEPAAHAVRNAVKDYAPECEVLVDAGCGEGYYTSLLSEISECTLGFDLSKFACAAGAKQARRDGKSGLLFATASVFELPLRDGCADVVTNIFAPCAEEEYCRVLKDGGILVVAGAGRDHLMGLKKAIYESVYENRERADLPKSMKHLGTVSSSFTVELSGKENISALFSMTPYYWRTGENDRKKLEGLESLVTEIDFEINIYKKD